jgi:D-cysteine desulfhydrase
VRTRASSQFSHGLPGQPQSADPRAAATDLPLFERFPALRALPRAELCSLPSRIELLPEFPGFGDIWIKRDDLNAPFCGGNKVRSLEFLLGAVRPGDTVVTLGGAGSTHVLSTVIHAARLGASTIAYRWRHDMNPVAEIVSQRIAEEVPTSRPGRSALVAMGRAAITRSTSKAHFIPIGGSTPLGALGHVNAALELVRQIDSGAIEKPDRIFLPLASGGTIAGLAVGFAAAKLDIELVGVRVGPRAFVGKRKVVRLARATSRLIAGMSRKNPIEVDLRRIRIEHRYFGGAYGRPLAAGADAATILLSRAGIRLDDTYSAKTFAAAKDAAHEFGGITLFWLTFDARCLTK